MSDTQASERLSVGMRGEKEVVVGQLHTASHLGSGSMAVYATPTMVLHMEEAALSCVDPLLPPGKATVGSFISVRHLAPTPLGMRVRIKATLTAIEGKLLTFSLEAFDDVEKIGEGSHVRAIIDTGRFAERLAEKVSHVSQVVR